MVNLPELVRLGLGGAGHARQLIVHSKVILEGDGGQGLAFVGHLHPLLGLNGLVETLVVPPANHQAAGELIHDDDLTVLHHIVHVLLHHPVGLDGLVDVVGQGQILRVVEAFDVEVFLRLFGPPGGDGGGAGLLVHDVVRLQLVLVLLGVHLPHPQHPQGTGKAVRHLVQLGGLVPPARDDKGGAGLVDEDGIHLVHNGVAPAPLHLVLAVDHHVVPQVVKAELVVGAVGDVRIVGGLLVLLVHAAHHQPHGEAHKAVELAHPFTVPAGQIIVDGDNMDPFSSQGVEVGGQGSHQGLAFTGFHLGDAPLVQDDAAHNLYREVAHLEHPVRSLPAGGKGLRQDIVQALPLLQPFFQPGGHVPQLPVAHPSELLLQGQDLVHQRLDALKLLFRVGAEDLFKKSHLSVTSYIYCDKYPD